MQSPRVQLGIGKLIPQLMRMFSVARLVPAINGCGGWIRTNDFHVMSVTRTARLLYPAIKSSHQTLDI